MWGCGQGITLSRGTLLHEINLISSLSMFYKMGAGSFPGVKRPGRGVDHPPPPSAEVKERVEPYISPSAPSWPVLRWTLPFHQNIVCSFPPFYFSRRTGTVHWLEKKLLVHLHITAVYRSIDRSIDFTQQSVPPPFISETSGSTLRTRLSILGSFYVIKATRAYIRPLNFIKCRS